MRDSFLRGRSGHQCSTVPSAMRCCILRSASVEEYFRFRYKEGMEMSLKTDRTLCTAKEAAKIFGCTAGRIRQLKIAGEVWSHLIGGHLLVFDLDEIKSKGKQPVARGRPRGSAPKSKRA